MEKKKRLGRGLKDISHYFISTDHNKEIKEESADYQDTEASSACHVVSIIDPFNPKRGASLTAKICLSLCENGLRTLAVDYEVLFPGIAFTLGCSIPGYLFSHFLQDCYKPDDLIYTTHSGLNILAPRFNIDDMQNLNTEEISLMLDTLLAAESKTDIIVVRGYDDIIAPFVEDAVFIIETSNEAVITAYSSIKSFIAGAKTGEQGVGIIVTEATDEADALTIYERIKKCTEQHSGISPHYYGYISNAETSSVSTIASNIISLRTAEKQNYKGKRPFFERLKSLAIRGRITEEEFSELRSDSGSY